jgi:hypothetical protein
MRKPIKRIVSLRMERLEDRTVPSGYSVDNTGDTGSGSGSSGDLRYCITQANAAGVATTIDASHVTGTIALTKPLPVITISVTITGPSLSGGAPQLTVQGGNGNSSPFRVFEIGGSPTSPLTVEFDNIEITAGEVIGDPTGSGAALNALGGGILFAPDSPSSGTNRLTINDCLIAGNTAAGAYNSAAGTGGLGAGGGVYTVNGDLVISGTTIESNSVGAGADSSGNFFADGLGGGVAIVGGSLTMAASDVGIDKMTGNIATGHSAFGGGIYGTSAPMSVADSTLSNNTAAGSAGLAAGGGLYDDGGNATFTNLSATYNVASGADADGGGVYIANADLIGTNLGLGNNQASAGADAAGGGLYYSAGTATVVGGTFGENSASGNGAAGGGISLNYASVNLSGGTVIQNNLATGGGSSSGGGIDSQGSVLSATDTLISGNDADGGMAKGGGLNVISGTATLTRLQVLSNTAEGGNAAGASGTVTGFAADGGGIYGSLAFASGTPVFNITDSEVDGNSALGGGAYSTGSNSPDVYLFGGAGVGGGLHVVTTDTSGRLTAGAWAKGCTFANNGATGGIASGSTKRTGTGGQASSAVRLLRAFTILRFSAIPRLAAIRPSRAMARESPGWRTEAGLGGTAQTACA